MWRTNPLGRDTSIGPYLSFPLQLCYAEGTRPICSKMALLPRHWVPHHASLDLLAVIDHAWGIQSGQIIIFHQPRFPWNKGISLTKLPFGVRSCEIAIIWPDPMCPHTTSHLNTQKWRLEDQCILCKKEIKQFPCWILFSGGGTLIQIWKYTKSDHLTSNKTCFCV